MYSLAIGIRSHRGLFLYPLLSRCYTLHVCNTFHTVSLSRGNKLQLSSYIFEVLCRACPAVATLLSTFSPSVPYILSRARQSRPKDEAKRKFLQTPRQPEKRGLAPSSVLNDRPRLCSWSHRRGFAGRGVRGGLMKSQIALIHFCCAWTIQPKNTLKQSR